MSLDVVPSDELVDEEKLDQLPEDAPQTLFQPAHDVAYRDDQAQDNVVPWQPGEDVIANADEAIDGAAYGDETVIESDIGSIADTHPQADTSLERSEYDDESVAGRAEAGEPNIENAVVSCHEPDEDQEKYDG